MTITQRNRYCTAYVSVNVCVLSSVVLNLEERKTQNQQVQESQREILLRRWRTLFTLSDAAGSTFPSRPVV